MSIALQGGTIMHPIMMVNGDRAGLLSEVASLTLSTEHPTANPMLDEWIRLARALIELMDA